MGFHKCSLVASTYNWPQALELLLLSVLKQTHLPDEVIIADDGSAEDTKILIKKFQETFPVPLIHIWQEDDGNRKSVIMNKAIAQAKYDYIIEIDGDIIIAENFIEDHLRFAEKGQYLYGSRVTIKASFLSELWQKKQIRFNLFSNGISKRGRTLHFPFLTKFIKPISHRSSKFRGCNVSFWRADFIKINGYNENFKGWGMEDSEMIQRLHNIGILAKRLKFAGIAFHIYHKEQSKDRVPVNVEIEKETTEKKITFTEKGISQYL
ncbi:glycosyl transferase [Flavobacterium noncentrifugens]|uniref:Glycosyltransferase involved in cell wall bisynthesis n=1 Tax=Flavobacterium noncentrifugens TaxID=1128970 RepID=A0A1G8VYB5_9FLAO|nr:glycosyltransferase family 2 protein [Flavobacterium noncentrifugens]GEP50673.1 glycosyl transferase [Flavobacterium noncentrifugens]SDJ70220.1 Glycosyltransferase involved in cell wall bisynthesis [Flavobacterium noncentrifugens]